MPVATRPKKRRPGPKPYHQNGHPRSGPVRPHGPDQLAVVVFSEQAKMLADFCDARSPVFGRCIQRLHQELGSLTNMSGGLRLSLDLLRKAPPGAYKRIWLASDGLPNVDEHGVMGLVKRSFRERVNINTIALGQVGNSDQKLLRRIANGTHRGRFVSVGSLRALTNALLHDRSHRQSFRGRSEWTVFCLDLSGSMLGPMGQKTTKLDVVQEALGRLVGFKQKLFT